MKLFSLSVLPRKILIPLIGILNRISKQVTLTGESLDPKIAFNVSDLQSSRDVLLYLLLLRMRVRWRGEAADLRVTS